MAVDIPLRRPALQLGLLGVLCLLLSGCERPATDNSAEAAVLPEWIDRVYPEPGQELSAIADVQVEHTASAPDERVRLTVDGTDVTAYSEEGRGQLVYDPARSTAPQPVQLEPGEHSATVERLRVDPETGAVEETLDTFTWDFSVR